MTSLLAGLGVLVIALLALLAYRLRQRDLAVRQLSRLYSALRQINQGIVRLPSRDELFARVCQVLVADGGFRLAWITWHDPARQTLVPVAQSGDTDGFLESIRISTDQGPESRGPSGTAFREGRHAICNDLLEDPEAAPWRSQVEPRGFCAAAAFPIRVGGVTAGTLSVIADVRGYFGDREVALLIEAAADLSFGLDNLAREEARQHAAQEAARERRFSIDLVDSLPGILYLYTEQGRFLRWNRNFEQVSGYTSDEIAGMHPLDFFPEEEQASLVARIGEVFTTGESSVEAFFLAKNGSKAPYFFTGRRILIDDTVCLVGMGIDVSERRRAETALRETLAGLEATVAARTSELSTALARAESADRLKSAFLATMSHELRTPLNSIIGFTGILLQGLAGALNAEQQKQLGMVRASARHLLDLIGDVLDISKIEAGQLEVRTEPVDLAAVIARVTGSVAPLLEKKGLTLETTVPPHLAPLLSDRRRVEQILLNLLNNAVKFTDAGGVRLVADEVDDFRATPDARPSPAVRVRVSDTGIGIKPDDMGTLFLPFRQIDSGLTRQHEGTGLGLAICRRLAGLLGGTIEAESTWGEGSTFSLTLPLARRVPS